MMEIETPHPPIILSEKEKLNDEFGETLDEICEDKKQAPIVSIEDDGDDLLKQLEDAIDDVGLTDTEKDMIEASKILDESNLVQDISESVKSNASFVTLDEISDQELDQEQTVFATPEGSPKALDTTNDDSISQNTVIENIGADLEDELQPDKKAEDELDLVISDLTEPPAPIVQTPISEETKTNSAEDDKAIENLLDEMDDIVDEKVDDSVIDLETPPEVKSPEKVTENGDEVLREEKLLEEESIKEDTSIIDLDLDELEKPEETRENDLDKEKLDESVVEIPDDDDPVVELPKPCEEENSNSDKTSEVSVKRKHDNDLDESGPPTKKAMEEVNEIQKPEKVATLEQSSSTTSEDSLLVATDHKRRASETEKSEEDSNDSYKRIKPTATLNSEVKVDEEEKKTPITEPLKFSDIPVKPEPEIQEKQSTALDFMKRFKSAFDKMTRRDLEEFVLQKVAEAIVQKSEISDLRVKVERNETLIQSFRGKIADLSKQLRDLDMVHQRVVKDLEAKTQEHVTPIKITRAVGLQVSQPRATNERPVARPPQQTTPPQARNPVPGPSQPTIRQPLPTLANQRSGVSPQQRLVQQQRAMHQQQVMVRSPQNPNGMASGQISPQRKKIVKYTPMRPPLSNAQQAMMQQQQKQDEMLLEQKKKAMMRQAQQQQLQRQLAQQQNRVQQIPGPVVNHNGRQLVMRKVVQPQARTAASISVVQPVQPGPKSYAIDLTDEEDARQAPAPASQKILVRTPAAVNQSLQAQMRVGSTVVSHVQQPLVNPAGRIPQMIGKASVLPVKRPLVGPKSVMQAQRQHPAPLPSSGPQPSNPAWKTTPPKPSIRINTVDSGIVISWTMNDVRDLSEFATINSYQIYAYQETNASPSTDMWRRVGDVKAMPLPMAVTLTQFQEGERYHFSVRAVDVHNRLGPFSAPRIWDENK